MRRLDAAGDPQERLYQQERIDGWLCSEWIVDGGLPVSVRVTLVQHAPASTARKAQQLGDERRESIGLGFDREAVREAVREAIIVTILEDYTARR